VNILPGAGVKWTLCGAELDKLVSGKWASEL